MEVSDGPLLTEAGASGFFLVGASSFKMTDTDRTGGRVSPGASRAKDYRSGVQRFEVRQQN